MGTTTDGEGVVEERKRSYSPRGSLVLSALDVLPDASIMVFDLDLVFVVVRGEALHDTGLDPHDLEERPAAEALSPSRWAFYEPFYRAALEGESSSIEVGSVAADGHRYVVNVGPVRDRAGAIIGGVAIATEVTEHLRLRAALEQSEARFRLVAENASDVVLRVDDEWDVGWVSPSVREVLGYDPGAILGASLKSFLTDESWQTIWEAYGAWDKADPLRVLLQLVAADSSLRWMEVVARSIGDDARAISVVNLRDVDAQVHAQRALEEREEQFRLTMEQAGVGMALTSERGEFLVVNPALARLLGYETHELVGRTFASITHPDDVAASRAILQKLLDGEEGAVSARKRYLRKDGGEVWVDLTSTAVRGADGGLRHFASQMADVTAEVEAQAQLARSEERFRLAMTAAPVGMAISDPDGRFVQVNDAFCTLVGLPEDSVLGATVSAFLAPDDAELVADMTAGLAHAGSSTFKHQHRLMSGDRELWVEHSASVLRDDQDRPVFYVHQFADHTEANELRQDLEFRATHDALTGVANRGELMRQLRLSLQRGRGGAAWLGVLFVDIDNLKPLNDEYGHRTGDAAIVAVAERLTGVVRVIDLVARIGGDEFVVLLEGLRSRDELRAIAEKCRLAVEGPVEVDGHLVHVSVSVGAVLAGQDETPDEVLARADHALHRAKDGGRHQVDLD